MNLQAKKLNDAELETISGGMDDKTFFAIATGPGFILGVIGGAIAAIYFLKEII